MALTITIDLPETVLQQIELVSRRQQRSVGDLVRESVIRQWQPVPALPDEVEAELAALPNLSDEALWLLARSTLTTEEQETLARLNQLAKMQPLQPTEEEQLAFLLNRYDRMLVRRAQAAALLQQRGYDLSDPAVLQPQ
jgi:hypothetical protein